MRIKNLHILAGNNDAIPVFQKTNTLRQRGKRIGIRGHKHFPIPIPYGQGGSLPASDHQIMVPGKNHDKRKRPLQPVHRCIGGVHRFFAFIHIGAYQMHNHFRVCFCGEHRAFLLQLRL